MAIPTDDAIVITPFGEPGDVDAFRRLTLAWLVQLFSVEPDDRLVLDDPETHIIANGGHILVARERDRVVGVCALLVVDPTAYELAKMSVESERRGAGIGRRLLHATIDHARSLGADMLLLNTSHRLENAIHLYQQAGFTPSDDPRHHRYGRADVFMELPLR